MGVDAVTSVWVGIKIDDGVWDDLKYDLPDGVLAEIDEGDGRFDDLEVQTEYVAEEVVGLGVRVYYHDWDNGVDEINLHDLATDADELLPRVKALFDAWGLNMTVGVYLRSDMW